MRYKYCVWFPMKPKETKFFTDFKKADSFLRKQKIEAYLNTNVGTVNEDTLKGNNAASTEFGQILWNMYWQSYTLKEFNKKIKNQGTPADRKFARTLFIGR